MISDNDFKNRNDDYLDSLSFGSDDGDDGYAYGVVVQIEDYQFNYKEGEYSVDGVVTVYGDLIELVLDGIYQGNMDQWVDVTEYSLLGELEEYLSHNEDFRNYVFDCVAGMN